MTIEELKKQEAEAEANGANCLPYPECVEQVQNTKNQATTANSNTGSTVDMECSVGGGFCEAKTQQGTQSNKQTTPQIIDGIDNQLLIIVGLIVFTIVILLMGILIALNRIAKKDIISRK